MNKDMITKIAFYAYKEKRLENDYLLLNMPESNVYVKLMKRLKGFGFDIHTLDIYKKNGILPDLCIFLDIPPINIKKIIKDKSVKTMVLLREADMISPLNYDLDRHKEFDYIFTWKRSLVDNKKYFYIPSAKIDLSKGIVVNKMFNRKLCTLINSNLTTSLKGELYSKRLEIVKWFEKKHLEDFDLWGYGWDIFRIKFFSKTILKSKLLAPKRISYKGIAKNKIETLSQYRFTICFENTCLIDDYISEKIFDAFLAETVPIYWGTPNIEKYIPKECFIDYRNFKNIDELYNFIKNMNKTDYLKFIENIRGFKYQKLNYWSVDNWINSIVKLILKIKDR